MMRLRLLPMVMLCAVAVLSLKVDALRRDWPGLMVSDAQAKAGEEAATKASEPTSEDVAKPVSGKTAMKDGMKPPEDTMKAEAEDTGGDKPVAPLVSGNISKGELEVLQSLAKRRETLEQRNEELRLRENLMAATEKRVEERIAKLKALEDQIKKLLRQHDKERDEQLNSLVKVYEKMKPKDAARIFEQLEMDILLQVTGRMKESKMAPVLAAMDPEKAKELTVELATQRRLPESGSKGKSEDAG